MAYTSNKTINGLEAITSLATGDELIVGDASDSNRAKKITKANLITDLADETQTLTNKSIDLASNTLTGTTAEFNTALSDGSFSTSAGTETLTNKSVDLASNTLTGTTAEFNTALSDGSFATLAGTETLTNKTLTSPSITTPTGIVKGDVGLGNVDNTADASQTSVGTVTSGNVDAVVSAASTTTAGKIEVATAAETTTGTDATRAVSPDGLAGSDYGKRVVTLLLLDDTADTATGDGQGDITFTTPIEMNGWNLVNAQASVETAGTTNTTDIQIYNVTQAADMLSTVITIDSTETSSYTAATPPVIDTANDDVATGDKIRVDCDAVSTTAAKGLQVILTFQLP